MRKTIIAFLAALAVALTSSAPASAASTYVVQPGDSLFLIAQKYHIGVNDLQTANSLHTSEIYPGQALTIPTENSGTSTKTTYIVKPGDTLFLIAQKYGISYLQLQQANNLMSTEIYPGQTLVISNSASGSAAAKTDYTSYRVQSGDSLFLISQRFGVSVAQLQSLNKINGSNILAGQYIKIPSARPAATASRGGFSWRDIELIARVVNGEARGESYVGQVAVAAVILNRLRDPGFPKTLAGVIYQPWAFTAFHDGQINAPMTASARRAAQAAIDGWDPTYGATYYWNPITATSKWIWSRKIITKIGNHVFAK